MAGDLHLFRRKKGGKAAIVVLNAPLTMPIHQHSFRGCVCIAEFIFTQFSSINCLCEHRFYEDSKAITYKKSKSASHEVFVEK